MVTASDLKSARLPPCTHSQPSRSRQLGAQGELLASGSRRQSESSNPATLSLIHISEPTRLALI
eukprot:4195189-Alexandrium_andersonii.AAC.1